MLHDLWLPQGYLLANSTKVQHRIASGETWQIYKGSNLNTILVVLPDLVQKWNDFELFSDSLFEKIVLADEIYYTLCCQKKYVLAPISKCSTPESKEDILAFAHALRESRSVLPHVSFHDAIYIEQYSRLLPTWTVSPSLDDEIVLGSWISGGVKVSTKSPRRLKKLTNNLSARDICEVVTVAGLTKNGNVANVESECASYETTCITTEKNVLSKEHTERQRFILHGRPELEEFFNEHVLDIINNADKYKQFGIKFPSSIILHGPPGCGKTFAVEKLVEHLDWPSYTIDSGSIGSPYIHATSKKIADIFEQAMNDTPSVIVIDEMEAFLSARQQDTSSGKHHIEEVAEFLRRIPEAINNNVLIIAMTNFIDMIDPAILRRGRFDNIIEVSMPSKDEVAALVEQLLSELPKAENIDLEKVVDALTGKALSDTAFTIREAARISAKAGKNEIDQDSLTLALNYLPKDEKVSKRRAGFI